MKHTHQTSRDIHKVTTDRKEITSKLINRTNKNFKIMNIRRVEILVLTNFLKILH